MIALTSFATGKFIPGQLGLSQSALAHGAGRVSMWGSEDLQRTQFYRDHREILDVPRGAGYWLWKPFIILTELERLSDGDYLIYCDSGNPEKPNEISRPLSQLTEWCHAHNGGMLPGVYVPQHGRNTRWIKGECFAVMGCDSDLYRNHPQIQATFSVWERHERSLDFVRTWLQWCKVPAALVDDHIDPSIPDAPDFVAHRHDQAVLTLLALKWGLKCFGSPVEVHWADKKIDRLIDRINGRPAQESFAEAFPSLAAA